MKDWHHKLPPEVVDMLKMTAEELNDFSGAVIRMEALSRITFRQAVQAVADSDSGEGGGAAMWGEGDSAVKQAEAAERKVQSRLSLAISAHKELVRAKFTRLDAQERFEKAVDIPRPTMIQFSAKMPTPQASVERLINMGRFDEARKTAKILNIEHEFDWSGA